MNLRFAASRRSNDGRTHETDVRAGLGPAAMAEKWMIGRAAMLPDADQRRPPQNTLRGAQIDAKVRARFRQNADSRLIHSRVARVRQTGWRFGELRASLTPQTREGFQICDHFALRVVVACRLILAVPRAGQGRGVDCPADVPQTRGRVGVLRGQMLAERAGFEPAVGYKPTHAFQACDLNRSSTSPVCAEHARLCAQARILASPPFEGDAGAADA